MANLQNNSLTQEEKEEIAAIHAHLAAEGRLGSRAEWKTVETDAD